MKHYELKLDLSSKGFTVETLVRRMIESGVKITKQTFYNKLNGKTEFTRTEIKALIEILQLTNDRIIAIFF